MRPIFAHVTEDMLKSSEDELRWLAIFLGAAQLWLCCRDTTLGLPWSQSASQQTLRVYQQHPTPQAKNQTCLKGRRSFKSKLTMVPRIFPFNMFIEVCHIQDAEQFLLPVSHSEQKKAIKLACNSHLGNQLLCLVLGQQIATRSSAIPNISCLQFAKPCMPSHVGVYSCPKARRPLSSQLEAR